MPRFEGELYLCGRLKDVIIVAGMNVSAEDVEGVAATVSGVKPGRVTAFGVPDERTGSEKVVVVAEIADGAGLGADDLAREIRSRVRHELEVVVSRVDLVPAHWIVKTTSGKERALGDPRAVGGRSGRRGRMSDVSAIEATLVRFLREELGVPPDECRADTPLFTSGLLDSFAMVALLAFAEERFGVLLLDSDAAAASLDTAATLARYVCAAGGRAS